MSAPTLDVSERRVRKFLRRADLALANPLFAHGAVLFELPLIFSINPEGDSIEAELGWPPFSLDVLKSAIVDCRVFFLSDEDCFLPSVVAALSQLSTREHARQLRTLKTFIGQFVNGQGLVGGNFMLSAGLSTESDDRSELYPSGQMAMDFIYGVALHEDDARLARLERAGGEGLMVYATAMELAHLVRGVAILREQIRRSADAGDLTIAVTVGPPSPWAADTPRPHPPVPSEQNEQPVSDACASSFASSLGGPMAGSGEASGPPAEASSP